MKQLIVNADDFGFTRDTNRGIVAAHREGILTATTLMANGSAFEHAVQLAGESPELDVGCHLTLIGGPSLVNGQPLPSSVPQLLQALARGRVNPADEFRRQIERILEAGLRPLHLDTHKHTHLLPPVLHAVGQLSREFSIPWVRRPFDLPAGTSLAPLPRRLLTAAVRVPGGYFTGILRRYGCRCTDYFAGFAVTGHLDGAHVAALAAHLPDGVTELMTHPGILGPELLAAHTRLKASREIELRALTAPGLRDALSRAGVVLRRYRDLPV